MTAVKFETEASVYWQAVSALRGRHPVNRRTAERALATLVCNGRHDALRERAASALGVNWPPVTAGVILGDEYPGPGGGTAA